MPRFIAAAALALVAAAPAHASIWVASDARSPALRVDGRGYAEVSWRDAAGARRTLLIPPRGRVLPGATLRGRNVARPTAAVQIPFKRVLLRTPDGRYWALQAWRVGRRSVDLRFSRWRGAPTVVTARTSCCRLGGETLEGEAEFQGRPVTGYSPTPEGKRVRATAYVDCFACPPNRTGWARIIGIFTRANGSYRLFVRPSWKGKRYRVTIAGPNVGATLAPDALAVAPSSA